MRSICVNYNSGTKKCESWWENDYQTLPQRRSLYQSYHQAPPSASEWCATDRWSRNSCRVPIRDIPLLGVIRGLDSTWINQAGEEEGMSWGYPHDSKSTSYGYNACKISMQGGNCNLLEAANLASINQIYASLYYVRSLRSCSSGHLWPSRRIHWDQMRL